MSALLAHNGDLCRRLIPVVVAPAQVVRSRRRGGRVDNADTIKYVRGRRVRITHRSPPVAFDNLPLDFGGVETPINNDCLKRLFLERCKPCSVRRGDSTRIGASSTRGTTARQGTTQYERGNSGKQGAGTHGEPFAALAGLSCASTSGTTSAASTHGGNVNKPPSIAKLPQSLRVWSMPFYIAGILPPFAETKEFFIRYQFLVRANDQESLVLPDILLLAFFPFTGAAIPIRSPGLPAKDCIKPPFIVCVILTVPAPTDWQGVEPQDASYQQPPEK